MGKIIWETTIVFFISLTTMFAQEVEVLAKQFDSAALPCKKIEIANQIIQKEPNASRTDSILLRGFTIVNNCDNPEVVVPFITNYLRRNPDKISSNLLLKKYEELLLLSEKMKTKEYQLKILINYSHELNHNGLNQEAIEVLDRPAFSQSLTEKYPKIFAARQFYLGRFYYKDTDLSESLYHYREGEKICLEYDQNQLLMGIYNNMSLIFRQINDIETSKKYLLKTLELVDTTSTRAATIYYNLGVRYREQNQLDSAIMCLHKSLRISNYTYGKPYSELATVHIVKEEYDKALAYLMKDEVIAFQTAANKELDNRKGKLGIIEFENGNYTKAKNLFKEAIELSENSDDFDYDNRRRYHQWYFRSSWMENNKEGMLEPFEQYIDMMDSIINLNNEYSVSQAEVVFQTERKERELELKKAKFEVLEQKIKKRNTWYFAISAITLLLCLAAFLQNGKKRAEIQLLKSELESKNSALIEALRQVERKEIRPDEITIDYATIDGNRKIAFQDIYYLRSEGKKSVFYTSKGVFEDYNLLKHWQDILEKTGRFLRVHKKFIVSLDKVCDSTYNQIKLKDPVFSSKDQRKDIPIDTFINFGRTYYNKTEIRTAIEERRNV